MSQDSELTNPFRNPVALVFEGVEREIVCVCVRARARDMTMNAPQQGEFHQEDPADVCV